MADHNLDNYAFCRLLALHVRSNALHASEFKLQSTYYEDEYDSFAHLFYHVGDWEEAEKLLMVQADWRTTMFGAESPKTLVSISDLASTYWNQGRWDEAEKLEVDVMNVRKAKLGSDHPHMLQHGTDSYIMQT
jgi:hypothetical protein